MTIPARYVVLDGPDGCGKSTQARLLVDRWRAAGVEVRHVREPGSTPVAEHLRRLLLDPATGSLDPTTEALLFSAARRELVRLEIEPARRAGATVVSERCFASTWVYQCLATEPGADRAAFAAATRAVHATAWPDLLVVLDVGAEEAARRVGPERDRIEARGAAYHERVAAAFRGLGGPGCLVGEVLGPGGVAVVDAGRGDPQEVHERVLAALRQRFPTEPEVTRR